MVIVRLEDNTEYMIDTDNESSARYDIEHKLRDHLDFRKIKCTMFIPAKLDKDNKYYNQLGGSTNDLKCSSGWTFKWD
jgi:hypothetical protein